MIMAYINYPNAHFTLHGNPSCGVVRMMRKAGQRIVTIDRPAISSELNCFARKHYRFAAQAKINDMWLKVDFGDAKFEKAVVRHIRRLLGDHYGPLAKAPIKTHQCRPSRRPG